MTDIVFLLLIFFMLTTTLVSSNGLKVDLPQSDNRVRKGQAVTVTITRAGAYFVNSDKTRYDHIADRLRLLLKHRQKPGFTIQAETGTPIEKVVDILDIARKNHYRATLATQPKS